MGNRQGLLADVLDILPTEPCLALPEKAAVRPAVSRVMTVR
jgi:hypothetical protein